MENGPFEDVVPIKNGDIQYSIAMPVYQAGYPFFSHLLAETIGLMHLLAFCRDLLQIQSCWRASTRLDVKCFMLHAWTAFLCKYCAFFHVFLCFSFLHATDSWWFVDSLRSSFWGLGS